MDKATRSQIAKSLRTAAAKLMAKAPVMPDAPKFDVHYPIGELGLYEYISDIFIKSLIPANQNSIGNRRRLVEGALTEAGQKQVDAAFKAGFEAGYQQGVEQGAEEEAFRR